MEKTLLERLKDAKHEHDVVYVCFYNDGSVREDERYFAELMKKADAKEQFKAISNVLCDATESYARHYDFNDIDMNLIIGLVFHKSDITEDNAIKPGAQPVLDIVRYYTGSVKSFLDDEQTSKVDFETYGVGRQGYVNFNQLVSRIKSSELKYSGPESFDELKDRILNGEVFDISISADLRQPEEQRQFIKK